METSLLNRPLVNLEWPSARFRGGSKLRRTLQVVGLQTKKLFLRSFVSYVWCLSKAAYLVQYAGILQNCIMLIASSPAQEFARQLNINVSDSWHRDQHAVIAFLPLYDRLFLFSVHAQWASIKKRSKFAFGLSFRTDRRFFSALIESNNVSPLNIFNPDDVSRPTVIASKNITITRNLHHPGRFGVRKLFRRVLCSLRSTLRNLCEPVPMGYIETKTVLSIHLPFPKGATPANCDWPRDSLESFIKKRAFASSKLQSLTVAVFELMKTQLWKLKTITIFPKCTR